MTTSRRGFIASIAATAAGTGLRSLAAPAPMQAASDRVNIALIGCGGRGTFVARGMIEQGANLTCICDLHPGRLERGKALFSKLQTPAPRAVNDLRYVLDAKDVDAVIVATPDHWHAPASILVCRAGKDVYVEKPHSHTMWESEQMVKVARKYKRVLQVGTQNRSAPYTMAAREYVTSGRLGKIGLVKVFNMKSGGSFSLGKTARQPDGFDWDHWLGGAPQRPYHERIFHGGWHKYWDFSGGDMADDGIHQIDLALMVMGDPGLPQSTRSAGGRYVHRGDDAEVPDVQIVNWDFGNFLMTFELTQYPKYMRKTTGTIRRNDALPYWTHNATRIEIYGSELMMTIGRHGGGWIVQQSGGKEVKRMYGRVPDTPHYANFLECVRTRRPPNADITIAHAANAALHAGNIAHRVGNISLRYDTESRRFDSPDANALIRPVYREGYEIKPEA